MTARVLGLGALQWMSVVVVLLSLIVVAESVLGHYRSGFPLRAQHAPILAGGALVAGAVAAIVAPDSARAVGWLRVAGWVAVAAGVVGAGYHHHYGIREKAGGYRLLLHYLMYGAPPLAPLALSAVGAVAVLVARELARELAQGGAVDAGSHRAILGVAAAALTGAVLQTGILHYRGAFNTPLMYVPLLVPPLAAGAAGWAALLTAPGAGPVALARLLLWATFVLGFVGLGMHLRGIDRQMGGLRVLPFNLVQGPPPLAPASFAGFAAVGLLALGRA